MKKLVDGYSPSHMVIVGFDPQENHEKTMKKPLRKPSDNHGSQDNQLPHQGYPFVFNAAAGCPKTRGRPHEVWSCWAGDISWRCLSGD